MTAGSRDGHPMSPAGAAAMGERKRVGARLDKRGQGGRGEKGVHRLFSAQVSCVCFVII